MFRCFELNGGEPVVLWPKYPNVETPCEDSPCKIIRPKVCIAVPEYDDGGKKPIKQEEKEAQEKEEEREEVEAAKTQGSPTKTLLQQRKEVWGIRKRKKEVPLLKRLQKNLIIRKKRAGQ